MQNDNRVPTREDLFAVIDRALSASSRVGHTHVFISAYWQGVTRWFRNRIGMSSNRTDYLVQILREIDGGYGSLYMNQIDDISIQSAMKFAEWKAVTEREDQKPNDYPLNVRQYRDPDAFVWSDHTAKYDFVDSGRVVQITCSKAEELGLMAAGNIECTAVSSAYSTYDKTTRTELRKHAQLSRGHLSITARHPKGSASGWAGLTDVDFGRIEEETLANKAFDKCLASMNPVRIEPGRYTAILEPQAVADLVSLIFASMPAMDRTRAEASGHGGHTHPFFLNYDSAAGLGRSKLGLKVFDERINVWHDPEDSDVGTIGFDPKHVGIDKISYVENGVLKSLPYDKWYSANRLQESENNVQRMSFRMSGGDMSIDDMLATTKRGLLVTRFSGGGIANASALVATGLTRDGLWLVENGKVTSAVRNFRTLESPFFVLNNVDKLGRPEKVYAEATETSMYPSFTALYSTRNFAPQFVVPSLRVLDFSFSATIDAV